MYQFQRQAARREWWQNFAYHAVEAGFTSCVVVVYLLAVYGLFDLIRRVFW